VWPTLYHVVAWQARHPLEVWALPKAAVIARLSAAEESLGQAIRDFYHGVTVYYQRPHRVEEALTVNEQPRSKRRGINPQTGKPSNSSSWTA
jgi:hypothetical protein